MKQLLANIRRLHNDQRGAEGLEKILIIAAIALPLLGLLLIFRGRISEWLQDSWTDMREDDTGLDDDFN